MRKSSFRLALLGYVGLIWITGAGLLLWGWTRPTPLGHAATLGTFGFWLMLSFASECFWLRTPTGAGMVSMSLAVNIASLFVLPFHLVLTVGLLSVGLSDLLLHRRTILKASFNAAQTAISLAAAFGIVYLIAGRTHLTGSQIFLQSPLAAPAAAVAFFVANTFSVSAVVSLHSRVPFWSAWRENYGFSYHFLSTGTLSLLGLTLVLSIEAIGTISGLLYLLFFLFIRDAYNRFVEERVRRSSQA